MNDKILIADDELSKRNILKQELRYRGCAVETAKDGSEKIGDLATGSAYT